MKVLVVCAHPDDETFGMGATIALHVRRGDQVTLVVLTDGTSARFAKRSQAKTAILNHKRSVSRAASILGISKVVFGDFPDQGLDTIPRLRVFKFLEAQVARIKPEVLYATHKGDLNEDHRIAFEAAAVAARPGKGMPVRKMMSFEVPSSTEWTPVTSSDHFRPDIFVDITSALKVKQKAVSAYATELRDYPHPRSAEAVDARARYWGVCSGYKFAEPFELVRELA